MSTTMLNDTGLRETFETGAMKDPGVNKGRCDLLPARAILRLARHYEAGAKKYPPRNWEKGIPTYQFIDSAMRHLLRFMAGDRTEDHLAAVLWNIAGYMETEAWVAEGVLPPEVLVDDFPADPWAVAAVFEPVEELP